MGLEMWSTNKHVGVIKTPLVSTPRKPKKWIFCLPSSFQCILNSPYLSCLVWGLWGWKMPDLCTRKKAPGVFHPYFCIVTPVCALYLRGLSPKHQQLSPETDVLGSPCWQGLLMFPNRNFCDLVSTVLSQYRALASYCWMYDFWTEVPMLTPKKSCFIMLKQKPSLLHMD